jgi:hypothetical protein
VLKDRTFNQQTNESIQNKGTRDFIYLAAKFLLKLPNKLGMNFAVNLAQSVGDIDKHSLAVARNINLAVNYEKTVN